MFVERGKSSGRGNGLAGMARHRYGDGPTPSLCIYVETGQTKPQRKRSLVLKHFRNDCGLVKTARSGFPWEKTTKSSFASVYTNCETALAGLLAARSPGLRFALALEIERHRGTDEILQGRLIDLVAFVDIDGTADIPVQAGVE